MFVLIEFIREFNWVLFAVPFIVLLFRFDKSKLLIALLFVAQIAYSVYVGGDAWEHKGGANRYISVAIPLFFILFVSGLDQIKNALLSAVKNYEPIIRITANIGLVLLVFLSLLNFNFLNGNRNNIKRIFLLYEPSFVDGNKWNLNIVHAVNKITTPEADIAVIGAGSIPYYTGRPAIDILGKCDSYIAHLPAHIPSGGLAKIRPGHMKWDYEHSFGKLKPDMILGVWEKPEEAEQILEEFYTVVEVNGDDYLVRKDSLEILWDQVD
jgi:hypothetical protein